MKSVLVTGGAGFVGSNVAIGLKQHFPQARVVAFDSLRRRGSELSLSRLQAAGVEFLHGDVRARPDIEAAGAVDFLVECSAEPSVLAGSDGNTDFLFQTNLDGAIHCAQFCARHRAGLLFISTSRVYPVASLTRSAVRETAERLELLDEQAIPGLSSHGVAETFPLAGTRTLYGATKLAAEIVLEEFRSAFGIPVIIDRCGVLAGAWQFGRSDQGIAAFWTAAHLTGRPLKYIGFGGTGKQVRDLLHIDDFVRLVVLQVADSARFSGRVFNVGGGSANSVSLRQLTAICQHVCGRRTEIGSVSETRYGDIPVFITDHRAITAHCGWRPERTVGDIVGDIRDWLNANPACLERCS